MDNAYITVDDLKRRLGDEFDFIASVNERLAEAMSDAEGEINSYLSSRYDLPLNTKHKLLEKVAADIVVYQLCNNDQLLTDDRRARYKDAVKVLVRISKGEIMLGANTQQEVDTLRASFSGETRQFTRANMEGL